MAQNILKHVEDFYFHFYQFYPMCRVILLVKQDCFLYHTEGREVERVCFTYEENESKVETEETPIATANPNIEQLQEMLRA